MASGRTGGVVAARRPSGGAERSRKISSAEARRQGRRRLVMLILVVATAIAVGLSLTGGGGRPAASPSAGGHTSGPRPAPHDDPRLALSAVESGLLPWQLNTPLSREVVLPAHDGRSLVVVGGLQPSPGGSDSGVFEVDPAGGAATQIGDLVAPTHDAAGAVAGGRGYVFGGGNAVPVAASERLSSLGTAATATPSSTSATRLGLLPQRRADAAAVVIGSRLYVVGGYDGSHGDPAVLATTNGARFTKVADLPVPVRYPAVAALAGEIYVFGGEATSGARAGAPVAVVQTVDPRTGRARVVGTLPEPVEGAAAVTLAGALYVAGGDTAPAADPSAAVHAVATIWAWSPERRSALVAGRLMVPVAHAGVATVASRAWLVGGETAAGVETADVQMIEPNRGFGVAGAPGAGSPYYGDKLLIADRGNNRLLVLDDTGRTIWTYPSPTRPGPPGGLYFPDDAFFTDHGKAIISNEEENDTIIEIAYPSGRVLWVYGHPRQPGSAPGYLDNPDDAYVLHDGDISVADPMNCRVLVLSRRRTIIDQIGTPGSCTHLPPNYVGSPNGDTPLSDGNLLVSEINGSWIDEYTPKGHLVWDVQLPIGYPSDPQPLGRDRYLVANYETPGAFVEFDRSGRILYDYGPSSGPGELNQPSLVERLPSGVLMANDDYNDRMMAIDPVTRALVWQYGRTGVAGTSAGLLNIPDGFDILGPGGTFPTHPSTS